MALKKTARGKVCPLDKFGFDYSGSHFGGGYDRDPVEACLKCNFSNLYGKEFNLEKICQCPEDMTWDEYDVLRDVYSSMAVEPSKQEFWNFVNEVHVFKKNAIKPKTLCCSELNF